MSVTEEQVVENVQKKLDALNFTSDEPVEAVNEPVPDEPKGDAEVVEAADTEAPVVQDSDAGVTEKATEDTLPDSMRRAAIHKGWTPEEIDSFYKEKPELAKKTLGKIHESTNKLSSQFAEMGRQAMQPPVVPTQPAETVQQATTVHGVDLSKLKDEYGDDPIIDVVRQLNDEIIRLRPAQPAATTQNVPVEQTAAVQEEVRQLIGGQINQFLSQIGKADDGHYGADKSWDEIDSKQVTNRMNMLKQADQIKVGAAAHGIRMSNTEAMTRAHILQTSAIQEKTIRAEIKGTLQKRQNNLTIEPANSLPLSESKGPLTANEVVKRASERLKSTFKT